MRKLVCLAAIAAGVVAMAVPAGAAAPAKTLNTTFAGGGATLTLHPNSTWSRVSVAGLEPGDYQYSVGLFADTNHDGTPDGGYTGTICRFHVNNGRTAPASCQKSGPSILRNFSGTPDIIMGFVDKLGNNTGVTVRSGVFS